MSTKNKNEDPEYLIRKAEKALNPGFFSAIFKSTSERLDDAYSKYETAADIYLVEKEYSKAAECYLKCAYVKELAKEPSFYSYEQAINCYKKTNDDKNFLITIEKCIKSFIDGGKFYQAAELEYEKGKIQERSQQFQEALESYDKALDFFEMDKDKKESIVREVKIAKANLICVNNLTEMIPEAKAIFEEAGDQCLNQSLAHKLLAKDYYTKNVLCYFVYDDYISAKAYMNKYFDNDNSFEQSSYGQLLKRIVKCFERGNDYKEEDDKILAVIIKFTMSIKNNKKAYDKFMENMLKKIKEKVNKEVVEDLNEEEDLR